MHDYEHGRAVTKELDHLGLPAGGTREGGFGEQVVDGMAEAGRAPALGHAIDGNVVRVRPNCLVGLSVRADEGDDLRDPQEVVGLEVDVPTDTSELPGDGQAVDPHDL